MINNGRLKNKKKAEEPLNWSQYSLKHSFSLDASSINKEAREKENEKEGKKERGREREKEGKHEEKR